MTWVKLDDGFADHPKVVTLSDKAFRCLVRAYCYCGRYDTDGLLPVGFMAPKYEDELVAAGLLDRPGYGERASVHDYLTYNPSREQVEEERRKARERRAKGGRGSGDVRANDINPDPTRPLPDPKDAESKAAPPSEDTQPTDDQLYLASKFDLTPAAVKKLNRKHGIVPVLEALRQLSDSPPPGLDKPFGWLDTVAAFKAVSA